MSSHPGSCPQALPPLSWPPLWCRTAHPGISHGEKRNTTAFTLSGQSNFVFSYWPLRKCSVYNQCWVHQLSLLKTAGKSEGDPLSSFLPEAVPFWVILSFSSCEESLSFPELTIATTLTVRAVLALRDELWASQNVYSSERCGSPTPRPGPRNTSSPCVPAPSTRPVAQGGEAGEDRQNPTG